jgi:hypothetical protein
MIIFLNTTERHVMNDEDLRDLFAGLAMQGILHIASFGYNSANVARASYEMADAMIEAKYYEEPEEPEEGITAIKPKRKVK